MASDVSALRLNYGLMRARLESLLGQPEKDMAMVDRLVSELERIQLDIKAELGVLGNNPNE
jgi:hypothetical protein